MISPRAFIAIVAVLLLAAPLAATAQQTGKVYRIGILYNGPAATFDSVGLLAFRQGLYNLGWIEGRNIMFERRVSTQVDRLPALATELVKLDVDVIMASPTTAALAAKQATTKIPVVVGWSADLVSSGVVTNLARPDGNITGLTLISGDLMGKRLQLLKEVAPGVSCIAFLSRAGILSGPLLKGLETAGQSLGVTVRLVKLTGTDVDPAFEEIVRAKAEALYVGEGPSIIPLAPRITAVAARLRLPTVFARHEYVEAGGLMSYGSNSSETYRRAAYYVDRILKGAKPADLPVEQPTKFELVINMKTAKLLGLTIPPSLLLQADQVIE